MKRLITIAALAISMTSFAGLALAHDSRGDFSPRMSRSEWRQHDGWRESRLTRGERMRLRARQRMVRQMIRVAMADGRITPRERALIARARAGQARAGFRMVHNGRMM